MALVTVPQQNEEPENNTTRVRLKMKGCVRVELTHNIRMKIVNEYRERTKKISLKAVKCI
jgi:hypothetical protein